MGLGGEGGEDKDGERGERKEGKERWVCEEREVWVITGSSIAQLVRAYGC